MVSASHLEKTILIKADRPQQKEKNEKVILSANNYTIDSNETIFFSTEHFSIIVNPDNQAVIETLKIVPMLTQLGDWNNWQRDHWIELLQVVRLCELTLIQAFDPPNSRLNPRQDDKLINCFSKQRSVENNADIYFDIVPRYKNEITFQRSDYYVEYNAVMHQGFELFKKEQEKTLASDVAMLQKHRPTQGSQEKKEEELDLKSIKLHSLKNAPKEANFNKQYEQQCNILLH